MTAKDNRACVYDRWSPRPLSKKARAAGLTQAEIIAQMDAESTYRMDRCREYCRFAGLEIVAEERDRFVSARKIRLADREAGARALAHLHRGVTNIVVYSMSRLFRNNIDGQLTLEKWRREKIAMHLAAEGGQCLHSASATGRFLLRVLLAKEQLEPEQTAERTSHAMKSHQRNGRPMSTIPPYGLRIENGVLVPDALQQILIERMRTMAATMSQRAIAKQLNAEGVPSATGGKWHHYMVGRVLNSILVAG